MEQYAVKWLRQPGGTVTDISARAGGLTYTDDLDSLATRLTLDVQQGTLDPYHKPLAISCGDRIQLYKDGALVVDGQITTVSGDYRERQQLTVYDDGVILTQNDLIIQYNGVSADTAIRQLCGKLGITVAAVPAMPAKITQIYHESVSSILTGILDTVTAETGRKFKIRVRGGKLYVAQTGTETVSARYRAADNLGAHPVQWQAGGPSVKRSIDELRNAVQIYSDQDGAVKILASASDSASIARYGSRMKVDTYSDKDGASAAQKAKTLLASLNRETEEISVQTFGADSVTAGVLMDFDLTEFSGKFLVTAVTKNYGHPYTMDLTLRRAE